MHRAVLALLLTLTLTLTLGLSAGAARVVLAARPAAPAGADWPQWRGPNRDGHAPEAQLPAMWPAQAPEPKWAADVGLGYSGPAVERGKVFVHARDDAKGRERCLCLDAATGKQLGEISYECKF